MTHWSSVSEVKEMQNEKTKNARKRKDMFVKWMSTLITFIIFFIPTWFWLGVYFVAGPTGFWQKFAILGLGTILAGGLQIALAAVWIGLVMNVIWD